mmetsp:Transcript_7567/g.19405  ORF Transcript_7567/g.19405 Transcript_7567/m.19405 type:complete len:675 (-) Transcript_7567:154-2178(-)
MRKRGVGAAWSRGLAKRGGNISRSRWIVVGVLLFTLLYFYNVWRLAFLSEDYRQEAWFLRKSGPQADDTFRAPGPIPAPPTIRRMFVISDASRHRGSKGMEENVERIASYLGFQSGSFSVFQATMADDLNREDCQEAGLITKGYSRPLSKVAVHLSHSRIWQKVVDENLDGLTLILEDDINLNFLSKADMATALEVTMNNTPADAGLVMLGRCGDDYRLSTKVNPYVVRPARPVCRHAYAVDVEMAKNMLAVAWPLREWGGMRHGDWIFRNKQLDMTRAYAPTCSILMQDRGNCTDEGCKQGDIASTNNEGGVHSTYHPALLDFLLVFVGVLIGKGHVLKKCAEPLLKPKTWFCRRWEDRSCPLTVARKNWRGSQWEEDRMDRVEESCSRGASLSSGLDTLCSARNFFHVVVPVRMNDYHALRSAVTSITRQDYPTDKFRIWLVDDSSNHPETLLALSELCSANKVSSIDEYDEVHRLLASGEDTIAAPFADLVWCLRLPNRLGPGSSKYMGFRLVESVAEPHEVVLVVDGDDMLSSAKALEVINKKYMDESVQCTYGSYRGKYGGKYGHPLSFKASLLPHMAREDFTDADGSWLQEASDIGFNDRILGLCGLDSVEYIPETIYQGSAELRLKWDTLFGVWQWGLVVILLSLLCLAAYAKQRPLGGFRYRYFRW